MSKPFFENVEKVAYEGPATENPLAYRYYDKRRVVLGKTMEEQLRAAVCYWHSFNWPGNDPFGMGTLDRPWLAASGSPLEQAFSKLDAAFEFFDKLGVSYFTFHDRDVSPEGATLRESNAMLARVIERMQEHMARTGVKLLWGTANLFSHPRYMSGAATNPDPQVFAYAAAQVKTALEVTQRLGGANYVLWGGREGYESLINTDMKRELDQLGRFLAMVAEHKAKLGFTGTLLIEPKPREPTKHQYDFDTATVHAFLQKYGLDQEYKVNIEANHATLAGHTFEHEVASAFAAGLFGSIDINRGDAQLGWDTDQIGNDLVELSLVSKRILEAGGFTTGGMNFDAKLRRQSIAREDLFYAHIGGLDALARSLLIAERMIADEKLDAVVKARYAGWNDALGRDISAGKLSLEQLADYVEREGIEPKPKSGAQERLENLLATYF